MEVTNHVWDEELGIHPFLPEGPDTKTLWQLIQEYLDRDIAMPPHQRELIWDAKKKRAWIDDLQNLRPLIGCFISYQLRNDRFRRVFLNDGSQRLRTTLEWFLNPEAYGNTKADAIRITKALRIIVQHRIYDSTDEAMRDFYRINSGTKCTAYEFMEGVLGYMDDYETLWRPVISGIHAHVGRGMVRVVGKDKFTRNTQHKFYRDNYALFLRYVTGDKVAVDYPSSEGDIELRDIENGRVMEFRLKDEFERIKYAASKKYLDDFGAFIDRETVTILDCWQAFIGDKGGSQVMECPNVTLYRALLAVAIWRRNNAVSTDKWEKFLTRVFRAGDGDAQFQSILANGRIERANFRLSGLSRLGTICRVIGSDFYVVETRERKSRAKIRPGADHGHVDPFATHGNGPTTPEPASRNRARGARPIEDDTDQRDT